MADIMNDLLMRIKLSQIWNQKDYLKIEISGEARQKEVPEIPSKAIREIVTNTFAHGSYGGNTTFEIDIFKDGVTIYSPGLFPLGYIPEDFVKNQKSQLC